MKQYFYIDSNNQQIGPVSKEQLIEMRNRGVISEQTNVWADGFPSWIPLIAILQNNETSRKECSQAELVEKKPRRRKVKTGNVAAVLYQSITNRKAQMYRNLAIGGVSLVVGFIAGYVFHTSNSVEGELPSIPEIPSFAELTSQGKDETTQRHTGKTTVQIKNKKQSEARSSHASEEAREELQRMGIPCVAHPKINVYYRGEVVGYYEADIIAFDSVILELKAVSHLMKEHEIQLRNYLKATNIEIGLLLNFGPKPEIHREVFTLYYREQLKKRNESASSVLSADEE